MIIAAVSVGSAIRMEQSRRHAPTLAIESNCAPSGIVMSDMSGMWMLIPFFLMGLGEVYANPTLLHYAYSKSAPTMRTLASAAFFFIIAVSSSLFALLVAALTKYIPAHLRAEKRLLLP